MKKKIGSILLAMIFSFAQAAEVDVPQDELATETVYPIFDTPVSVKNRNVSTEGRLDLGLVGGLALTEPIADSMKYGIEANYHFSEHHSLGLFFLMNKSGLSRDAVGIHDQYGLDYSRAPQPENNVMLDYNYKPFYGKMSITKSAVINTIIYGSLSGGIVKYQHKAYPAIALGIGERFYFTNRLSLKTDLRFFIHNAPIPFKSPGLCDGTVPTCGANGAAGDPVPSYSEFNERLTYTTNLEVGLNFLF